MKKFAQAGVMPAILAAVLFGAGTPLAKVLLGQVSPWLLAALLYLGSGVGLFVWRRVIRAAPVVLPRAERGWLLGAVVAGGVVGPVLLMAGLSAMSASGASLLLNAEGVLTAVIAWVVFRENVDRRIALGMAALVAGGVVLAWPAGNSTGPLWPSLAVVGACLAWGIDNNLTRKVSLTDATWIAMVKGLTAGATNLVLAFSLGAVWPSAAVVSMAAVLGFASYGASLALFVLGLRHLGTARTGAYFSMAPFVGAALSIAVLGEPVTPGLLLAGALMAVGLYLHLTESHGHSHRHEALDHDHAHDHSAPDGHHDHTHGAADRATATGRHSHAHHHAPGVHSHAHFPDAHHRHSH